MNKTDFNQAQLDKYLNERLRQHGRAGWYRIKLIQLPGRRVGRGWSEEYRCGIIENCGSGLFVRTFHADAKDKAVAVEAAINVLLQEIAFFEGNQWGDVKEKPC